MFLKNRAGMETLQIVILTILGLIMAIGATYRIYLVDKAGAATIESSVNQIPVFPE